MQNTRYKKFSSIVGGLVLLVIAAMEELWCRGGHVGPELELKHEHDMLIQYKVWWTYAIGNT